MSKDVLIWAMTAYAARTGINAFRKEIKDHISSQKPFPLSLFVGLLPVNAENSEAFSRRGNLIISGKQFRNVATDQLRLIINDPAMKRY